MKEYICPHCKQSIYDEDALRCLYCGELLDRGSDGFLGKIRYPKPKVLLAAIALLVILAFLLIIIRW